MRDIDDHIRAMNILEQAEIENRNQIVDKDGNVSTDSLLKRLIRWFNRDGDRVEDPNRRNRLKIASMAPIIGLTKPLHGLADFANTIDQATEDESGSRLEEMSVSELQQTLETLLEGRNVGLNVKKISPTGEEIFNIAIQSETEYPIASSFKAWVALYYLWHTAPEEWSMGKGTDIYNVAVYSHNRATGDILQEVYERRQESLNSDERSLNAIELFNKFLQEVVGIEHGLQSWGFESGTAGLTDDTQGPNTLSVDNRQVMVSNISTANDLSKGYEFLLKAPNSAYWNDHKEAIQATWYLLSRIDPAVHSSPDESAFLGFPSAGKDGYLEPNTFPEIPGASHTGGSLTWVGDGWLVVTHLSMNESGAVLDGPEGTSTVFSTIEDYTKMACPFTLSELEQTNPLSPSEYTNECIRSGSPEEFSGNEQIDRRGAVEVNFDQFLGDEYAGVLTVNIFDGTVSLFEKENDTYTPRFETLALVGQRLPRVTELEERYRVAYPDGGGTYDADHGVVYEHFGDGNLIPRHTLTPQLVANLEGFIATDGFGGLPVRTQHAVLKVINRDGVASLNSQFTFHEKPPMDTEHYRRRGINLETGNYLQSEQVETKINVNWSHGCVNLLRSKYLEIKQLIQDIEQRNPGKQIGVVFSYPGFDQNRLLRDYDYHGGNDSLYSSNLSDWAGSAFFADGF